MFDAFLAQWYKALLIAETVVLLAVGSYAGWLHLVTVPALQADVKVLTAERQSWELTTQACQTANGSLAGSIERQNQAIQQLAEATKLSREEVSVLLKRLGVTLSQVPAQLAAFKPDPRKSDCENAKAELAAFRAERGR